MIETFVIGIILGFCLGLIIGKHKVNKTENYIDAMEEIDREIAKQELERWKK